MNIKTEMAIRNVAACDTEIKSEWLELAIKVLRGEDPRKDEIVHVLRRKDVMKLLHVHRRTLDYYIEKGYLKRVYGGGTRALGITRDSFNEFVKRTVTKKGK